MIVDHDSFHDSKIIEVKENANEHCLDLLLDYMNWNGDKIEKRILRFSNVSLYSVDEIPINGMPVIMEIHNFGEIKKIFGNGSNQLEVLRNRIEIHTNAGHRIVEFSECTLMEPLS